MIELKNFNSNDVNHLPLIQNTQENNSWYYTQETDSLLTPKNLGLINQGIIEYSLKEPKVFLNKVNTETKPIKLQDVDKHVLDGLPKHVSSYSLEWVNSIYSYNSNYNKLLFVADKQLLSLVGSYLNIKRKRVQKKRVILRAKKLGLRYSEYRNRKIPFFGVKKVFSLNRVHVARGGIKHTGSKGLITIFVWKKKHTAIGKTSLKNLMHLTFFLTIKNIVGRKVITKVKSVRDTFTKLGEKEFKYKYRKSHRKAHFRIFNRVLKFINILKTNLFSHKELSLLFYFNKKYIIKTIRQTIPSIDNKKIKSPLFFYEKKGGVEAVAYWKAHLHRKISLKFNRFYRLFSLNEKVFKKSFIENFRKIVSKLYNKEISFNFVKLNKFAFNSDLFSKFVALRLRRREFGLGRLLNRSLDRLSLPRLPFKDKLVVLKSKFRINNLHRNKVSDLFSAKINRKKYGFESILFKFGPIVNPISIFGRLMLIHRKINDIKNQIKTSQKQFKRLFKSFFDIAKHVKDQILAGVRVEASGRLTKRFKASRAVYSVRYIGGDRNIDSSYEEMSTIMLRGHALPNVQYSLVSSIRKIGAFGVKVSVSSTDRRFLSSFKKNNNKNILFSVFTKENFFKHLTLKNILLGSFFIGLVFLVKLIIIPIIAKMYNLHFDMLNEVFVWIASLGIFGISFGNMYHVIGSSEYSKDLNIKPKSNSSYRTSSDESNSSGYDSSYIGSSDSDSEDNMTKAKNPKVVNTSSETKEDKKSNISQNTKDQDSLSAEKPVRKGPNIKMCRKRNLEEIPEDKLNNKEKKELRDKLKRRKIYQENTKERLEKNKEYYEANRDKIREYKKEYRELNIRRVIKKDNLYRAKNREATNETARKYREENREILREKARIYREKNREKINAKKRKKP